MLIDDHLDPEEGEEVVGGPQRSGVLHRVRRHPVPLLADVHPPVQKKIVMRRQFVREKMILHRKTGTGKTKIAVCSFRVIFNPN